MHYLLQNLELPNRNLAAARVNCSVFTLTALEPEEASMQIIGVDLHIRQQTIAMFDTETGELLEKTLEHDGDEVRKFYSPLTGPVQGLEAWIDALVSGVDGELGIDCRVGHPSEIRKAEARKQKHDRRDAALLLKLQVEKRFPSIWMPSSELRDLRTLLRHRHQWVRIRTRVQNTLQAMALSHGLRRGKKLADSGSVRCERVGWWSSKSPGTPVRSICSALPVHRIFTCIS
jgi:hypothetical protein